MTAGKPYDATAKELLQTDPAGWAAFLGIARPPDRVKLIESELSTVTAAADKVIRIEDDPPWLLDVEFQSWRDPSAPRQLLKYNALLHEKYKLPAASVLVVLAEVAYTPAYSGRYPVAAPFGPAWEFGYTVVRVWELDPGRLLSGPLALAPLAPVSNLPVTEAADVVLEVSRRASRETDPVTATRLQTAVGLLLQLRYGPVTAQEIIRKYPEIREYAAFKTFLEEGRAEGRAEGKVEGLRGSVLRLGRKKFGPPTPEQEAAVNAITDLARLEALSEKLLDVSTWDELLKPD
jgi:predicted transposase YdaD